MQIRTLSISCLLLLSITPWLAPKTLAQAISPAAVTARGAWEIGPFANGGFGTGDRSSFTFFDAGLHSGIVLTRPVGPGLVKGQFEYAAEIVPLWQAYTPPERLQNVSYVSGGVRHYVQVPISGGTFNGISITPIILRWNFQPAGKLVPFIQGAGGLIWTNHKFPPDYLVPEGVPGRTSVFNFSPQFGVGLHYFVRSKQSISLGANAVHISSASLGDRNPGVNASVQLQLGYTWWK